MTALPTGEQLPEYDDEPQVDPATLLEWLNTHRPDRWSGCVCASVPCPSGDNTRQLVADVLTALQVAGGATLIKNEMYRAMMRDRRELERLAAGITGAGLANRLLENDGNAVDTALHIITLAKRAGDELANMAPWLRTGVQG